MKKTTISMLVAIMLALALSGCGTTETKPETADQNQASQTQQLDETQTQQQQAEQPAEETQPKSQEEQKSEENVQTHEQTNPETKTEETPTNNDEEKPYSEGEFDGHYFKCKLPENWVAKEDPTQGYATIILDPKQNAGVAVQTVENNEDSAQVRAEGVATQFNGTVEDVKLGNNSYKRITTSQKDPNTQNDVVVGYLICVIGTKAYYLSTPIYGQQATQELLSNIQFK